ncbi:unnamed protein product [Moneuplotes crassus]|uniref:Uncharacterized protein n=1 Tax=Euplotes crassus TaxID=5936 RepID=A0AAD1XSN7_EUPCR|nr:unnamed protein product [Moneuplotes crassus]
MQRISRSQHPIAKKWQCFGCCMLISMILYFLNFMLTSTFAFGEGGALGIVCFIIDIGFIFVAFSTYGVFLGQKGGKLIAGLVIGAVGFSNILVLMVLIVNSRNNDCEDSFDCPLYGSFPVIIIILFYLAALMFPGLYFTAMVLSHVPSWDPNKVLEEGGDGNAAVVVEQNAPIQIMDPNAGQNNNPYINHNPSNPQPQMFAPQVIIMEPMPMPMPMDPNAGIQMGMQPTYNNQNAYQPNSQAPQNTSSQAMYTPSGPAATGIDNTETGHPV